ncbi:MAG TPA: NlpC/P60 family protein [Bauldia sp.]|nr:NlpC/P60 family protein [Bauldia sp.]
MTLDRRLNAFRPDVADVRLKGQVAADRFVEGVPGRVVAPSAPLKPAPSPEASLDSELVRGEEVLVFDATGEGWSFVQSRVDGYVGYAPSDALGSAEPAPTHRVTALRTFIYPGPDMKLPAIAALSLGSTITLAGEAETRGTRFGLLTGGEGAVFLGHVDPIDAPPEPDFVAVAERFVGIPYLWGGRTSLGLDGSALVQVALRAAGTAVLRDTDMQRDTIGTALDPGAGTARGDLVFWPGHVAVVLGDGRIVHASGRHMSVVTEPLAEALARIGAPTVVRRPD